MTTEALTRVRYYAKQFLRVDEFRDEQLYQLTLRRLHNNAQHTWGIVSGLDIVNEDDATVVRPGYAIDGYGRELLLTEKFPLVAENFEALATDRLDIWLVYARGDDGSVPTGYGECAGSDGLSYRASEEPTVLIERTLSNTVNARRPPGVSRDVLDSPVPPTSDDPADAWRVYLGRIIRLDDEVVIEPGPRPYAGVVAEVVDHPANATRVEIGGQSSPQRLVGGVTYTYSGDPQHRRFAAFVPESTPGATELAPRLEILDNEEIHLRGQTIMHGNLRTVGGAVQFGGAAGASAANPPAQPSIYRFKDDSADTLRVDLGSDTTRRFIIGFSSPDGHFTECLRVELVDTSQTGDKTPLVTVAGDLKVNGKLVGQFIDPALSAEALAAIFGSFQAGMVAGNAAP